ncbi:vitamin B12-dependent ribonucleotide reductase [candidate division KSB1 bacterium]|nr:vitamin B12-dependent ribonucleotide reductase [candidate division KSB1 bacterium]
MDVQAGKSDREIKHVVESHDSKQAVSNLLPKKSISGNGKPALSENALTVLERRYLLKDEQGKVIESPDEMFHRVARFIASADTAYDKNADIDALEQEFYHVMRHLEFLPNSPTLMNAGRKLGQLSACFVLPIDDTMESIFETIKNTALIHKSGGGTGFSFSRIRPNNDIVQSTKGISSGPISFLKVFDAATEAIKQGGTRRGANMAILRVDHPDIVEFISCKSDHQQLNNFNISVALTDAFMLALEKDTNYDLINPRTKTVAGQLRAKDVFDKIVTHAWENGDPGIVFVDRINKDNPTPAIGDMESTNPCGEQPLLPYESCNLGSINLSKMIRAGKVDYDKLKSTIRTAVHFLDNVIDKNEYPLEAISKLTRANRKIGLGVMGFADMLIDLGIPYDSEQAIETAETVMSFINEEARKMSQELAEKRGEFSNYKKSIYANGKKIRNATRTTIAPTGTLSIIADCSSGVEPLFALSFVRHVMDDDKLLSVQPRFEQAARREGFYSDGLMEKIAESGTIQEYNDIPDSVKNVFVTSHDIKPYWHIRMQAAFQKYTDNAVSKTVNFPNQATVSDVKEVYVLAHELGCKGVTIYRDGSRDVQVLNKGKQQSGQAAVSAPITVPVPAKKRRPTLLQGKTMKMNTGCGALYVTLNEDDNGLFELFNTMGKAGGCAASQSEAIGRLVSLAWRHNIKPEEIIRELSGISCHKPYGFGADRNLSCADSIANAIRTYLNLNREDVSDLTMRSGACPDCGGPMEHESGCVVCRSCGYSECG